MTASSTQKDIPAKVISLSNLEHAIIDFDAVLSRISERFVTDSRVCNLVAIARNDIFRVQQSLHGLDILDFCCGPSVEDHPHTDDPQKRGKEAA